MAKRELKIHMLRPQEGQIMDPYTALCGKITANHGTTDPETVSCKSCSGIYRTNMEWYSQVKNRHMVAKDNTGSGDIYTRQDVEAGLIRLGWREHAIREVLDQTNIFRNICIPTNEELGRDEPDATISWRLP